MNSVHAKKASKYERLRARTELKASLKDETVQFEIELKGITTGTDATLYRMAQFWKQANVGPFVIVAFFVLFLQQDLQELFQAFLPAPMSMSERAAESLGM